VYDITKFISKHPGGDVIVIAAGRESSALLESYHSPAAHVVMLDALKKQCPVVGTFPEPKVTPGTDEKFFKVLRHRVYGLLKEQGVSWRQSPISAFLELTAIVSLFCFTFYMRTVTGSFVWAILAGIMTSRIGFLMHCGNHASFSSSTWLNKAAAFTMDIVGGSALVWLFDHGIAHHVSPNELGHDNDCAISYPLLRLHPKLKRRWWHWNQQWIAQTVMCFSLISWYVMDFVCLFNGAVGSTKIVPKRYDYLTVAFAKLVWFLCNVYIPCSIHGVAKGLALIVVCLSTGSVILQNTFVVNHIQPGLEHGDNEHWARKQVISSCNWGSGSKLLNFISGGLNHQIEHHLFPSMNVYNYPLISDLVRQTCHEFHMPYYDFPSFVAAHKSMRSYLQVMGAQDQVPKSMYLAQLLDDQWNEESS
jgi:linoleoyl-CoA desaturase